MSVKTGAFIMSPTVEKVLGTTSKGVAEEAVKTILKFTKKERIDKEGAARAESIRNDIRATVNKNTNKTILEKSGEEQLDIRNDATLAFLKEDALLRNKVGDTEEEKKEFFNSYLSNEAEYLVEGAWLTCTQATNEVLFVRTPDNEIVGIAQGNSGRMENRLMNASQPANDGTAKYGCTWDCSRGVHIARSFRNCSLAKENDPLVLEYFDDCDTYGTCHILMDLCEDWLNVQEGVEFKAPTIEEYKHCINMLSRLGCYQGGIIFPLDTGQGVSEEEIVDEETNFENIKEEILRLLDLPNGLALVDELLTEVRVNNPDIDTFLEIMAMREGSGRYDAHRAGSEYLGRYQIGDLTFQQIGFKDDDLNWTQLANKLGVTSEESYLANPLAQEIAIIFTLRWNYQFILSNKDDQYIGDKIDGVEVTESGLIGAYHLVGHKATHKAFIGEVAWEDTEDENEVGALEYMEEMGGFDLSSLWGGIE